MNLSICLPVAGNFDEVWFTIQALRMYHDLTDVEIIVLDNTPNTPTGKKLKEHIARYQPGNRGVKYIPYDDIQGSAAAKEAAIQAASGDIILCMDSHVLLPTNAIHNLINYFSSNPESKDLLCGPMWDDNLQRLSTQFARKWGSGMLGTWASTWRLEDGRHITLTDNDGVCWFQKAETGETIQYIDGLPFPGHEHTLKSKGAKLLGTQPTDIFPIWAMGCGLFACLKKNWVGFHPAFRGFGGEEVYIHEKFRQAGGRVLSVGFLRWLHKFTRLDGVKYRLDSFDKLRNIYIGWDSLKAPSLPLFEVKEHFLSGGQFTEDDWNALAEAPLTTLSKPVREITIQDLYKSQKEKSKYYGPLFPSITNYAKGQRCALVDRDRDASIALLGSEPASLRVYRYYGFNQLEYDGWARMASSVDFGYTGVENNTPDIEECDVLFFKSPHASQTIKADLEHFAPRVKRYILLHDTERNNITMDGGGIGHFPQIKDFLHHNPTWFVKSHLKLAVGMTVLGCREEDKPEHPITLIVDDGPGHQLKEIIWSLGIKASKNCGCFAAAFWMDGIYMFKGIEATKAAEDDVVKLIEENYANLGWKASLLKFKAGTLSLINGMAWDLEDWNDIPRSLFRLAIKRFEEKAAE